MRDAVTNLIRNYDVSGRYLDRNGIDTLKAYFETGTARVAAAAVINGNAAAIVKQAGLRLFEELPELIRSLVEMLTRLVAMPPVCGIWIIICAMPAML